MPPPPEAPDADARELLSIGDLAAAAGIAPDTLRVWERRYGRPTPVRLPSGHRRYARRQVRWLRRVAEALSLGHRPGSVVPRSEKELDELLCHSAGAAACRETLALVELVRRYDGVELSRRLARAWKTLGPRRFLAERIAPLLEAVGRAWSDGRLEIRHEHYASEVIQDLLRSLRVGKAPPAGAPVVVLATLQGEAHGLGLRMAAVAIACGGAHPRILGTDVPNEQIVAAVEELGARAVAVSVSLATGGVDTDRRLAELRRRLPASIPLVVGGRGARGPRRGPRGVVFLPGLDGLEQFAAGISGAGGAAGGECAR